MEQPKLYFRKVTQTGVWMPNEDGRARGRLLGDTAVTTLEGKEGLD